MRRLWVLLAAMACLAPTQAAHAQRSPGGFDRLVIDRIDFEPSQLHGLARLRVHVSALSLQQGGVVIPIAGSGAWQLRVGSSVKKLPYLAGTFDGASASTAIVLVVETAAELAPVLGNVKRALSDELVEKLGPRTQIGVVGYADDLVDDGKLGPLRDAAGRIDRLEAESSPGSPDLVAAVERALSVLKRQKPGPDGLPVRKMIVLVSDGRDDTDDRQEITTLGKKAAKDGVRIHSFAFLPAVPKASKGPFLNLGELSKQSLGTFRWVRTAGEQSWRDLFGRLGNEIQRQYVLTFFVPTEEVQGRQISLSTELKGRTLESNKARVPVLSCGGAPCAGDIYCVPGRCVTRGEAGRGVLGWILLIGGVLLGLGVAAVGVAAVIGLIHRRRGAVAAPVAPGPAPGPATHAAAPAGPPTGAIQPIPSGYPPSQAYPAAPVAAAAAAAQPVLFVLSGPRTGQRLPLHHGFVIGKAPGSHLLLDQDGFASGQHAMILMDTRGHCTLVDRGSTNGTFVNGIRVTTQVALTHGVAIRVGSTELRFLAQ